MQFEHLPVMLEECLDALAIREDGVYVDGTAGGAGHSQAIAERLGPKGRLLAFDADPDAVAAASQRLASFPNAQVVRTNFENIKAVLHEQGVERIDGLLLDLGVSSHQLDTPERGFSYNEEAVLDMRMSQSGLSARELVNTWDVYELSRILREYGEEKFAWNIAKAIVRERQQREIVTTTELAALVKRVIPAKAARQDTKHPARRTFQAIRIAVNAELDVLSRTLDDALDCLADEGRMAVLTFHSLEDRIVKQRFAGWAKGCTCPPDFPVCVCGNQPKAAFVRRKPVTAGEQELERNPRSRSAKLRAVRKLGLQGEN